MSAPLSYTVWNDQWAKIKWSQAKIDLLMKAERLNMQLWGAEDMPTANLNEKQHRHSTKTQGQASHYTYLCSYQYKWKFWINCNFWKWDTVSPVNTFSLFVKNRQTNTFCKQWNIYRLFNENTLNQSPKYKIHSGASALHRRTEQFPSTSHK